MRIYTVAEIALYLRVSEALIYKLTKAKKIPHKRLGDKRIFFSEKDIEEIVEGSHIAPTGITYNG